MGTPGEPGEPGTPGTSPTIEELLRVSRVQEDICICVRTYTQMIVWFVLSLLQVICEQAVLTGNQTLQVSCCQMWLFDWVYCIWCVEYETAVLQCLALLLYFFCCCICKGALLWAVSRSPWTSRWPRLTGTTWTQWNGWQSRQPGGEWKSGGTGPPRITGVHCTHHYMSVQFAYTAKAFVSERGLCCQNFQLADLLSATKVQ